MSERLCGLYGRVSTTRQAEVLDGGLDSQFDMMERRVTWEHDNDPAAPWTVVDRYREEGFSGKNLERPEFKRMMVDIESGRINTVVVQKIDRISRSLRDFFDLWELFEKHGVQFLSLHEKFDSTTAVGRAMLKLILVFAELEREQTSERTTATLAYRARQGLRNGGRIYGYDLDPEKKGVLKIVPEQASHVQHNFFEKCVELGSAGAVHRYLHEKGIYSPVYKSRRGRTHGGTPFTKPAVIRVLTNPFYLGKIQHKDEIYDGQHEAIVPEKLFNKVQAILGKNRKTCTVTREQRTHTFLLQGLMRCGKCGCIMTPRSSHGRGGKRYFYYECSKGAHSANLDCDTAYVPAEPIEKFLIEQLRKAVLTEDEIRRVVKRANGKRGEVMQKFAEEEARLITKRSKVQAKIENIVDAVEDGKPMRSFEKRLKKLEREEALLTKEVDGLRLKKDKTEEKLLSAEVIAENYRAVPEIIDGLVATKNWSRLKSLLSQYVEAIQWNESEDDRKAGEVKIMLFEHAYLPDDESRKEMSASLVNNGALKCNDWLLLQDLNLRPSG